MKLNKSVPFVLMFLALLLAACANNPTPSPSTPADQQNTATPPTAEVTNSPVPDTLKLAGQSTQIEPGPACPPGDAEAYLLGELMAANQPAGQSPTAAFDDFNRHIMQSFLENNCYADWAHDKTVRDTGPFVENQGYGTHPAVVIFYSPIVIDWLEKGRALEDLKDGAVVIKVQFASPAAQYADPMPSLDSPNFLGWSIAIRYAEVSRDGWYWGGYDMQPQPGLTEYPYHEYPYGGVGQINACMRCHAVAADEAYIFADLRNIAGYPGESLTYLVDDSWRTPAATSPPEATSAPAAIPTPLPTRQPDPFFVSTYTELSPVAADEVVPFPNIIYDTVVSGHDGPPQFITSNQCTTCHGGLSGPPFGPLMVLPPSDEEEPVGNQAHEPGSSHSSLQDSLGNEGLNVSPSGEWHWSMMGLAGRDPIFFSQLESEMNLHDDHGIPEIVQDTCLRCHGVMGQRQFHLDQGADERFTKDHVYNTDHYGGLARDGISCMVCHQIAAGSNLVDTDTGRFVVPPVEDQRLAVNGPYENPDTFAMISGLAIEPVANDFIKSSQVCQSCHTIRLPVFDADNRLLVTEAETTLQLFEQTTFLEWLNSDFAQGNTAKACQECHMPTQLNGDGPTLEFKIAGIQDQDYPYSEHAVALTDRMVNPRPDFARHALHGINLFALEMFNQFADILGVSKSDYMTGNQHDLDFAIANYNAMARGETAAVTLAPPAIEADNLVVDVTVTNNTGHRFPSGVGFRRAFINFNVIDDHGNVVWTSGGTNSLGIIVGPDGEPLPTEFLPDADTFQPHYQMITNQEQVQIYEELTLDPQNEFTTSFISRCRLGKDNRLLARGWSATPGTDFPVYSANDKAPVLANVPSVPNDDYDCEAEETSFTATLPAESVREEDPDYAPGSNADTVRYQIPLADLPGQVNQSWRVEATLFYQATPPYYLQDRFQAGTQGGGDDLMESQRLYYLASHLELEGTPVENWRLLIDTDSASLPGTAPVGSLSTALDFTWVSLVLLVVMIGGLVTIFARRQMSVGVVHL